MKIKNSFRSEEAKVISFPRLIVIAQVQCHEFKNIMINFIFFWKNKCINQIHFFTKNSKYFSFYGWFDSRIILARSVQCAVAIIFANDKWSIVRWLHLYAFMVEWIFDFGFDWEMSRCQFLFIMCTKINLIYLFNKYPIPTP